jgi:hypothetical protein
LAPAAAAGALGVLALLALDPESEELVLLDGVALEDEAAGLLLEEPPSFLVEL